MAPNSSEIEDAARLRGLRDALDLTVEKMAAELGVTPEQIKDYEDGKTEIPVSFLTDVAHTYKVSLTELLSGRPAHLHMYAVTKKGEGTVIKRSKSYDYLSLASRFDRRKMEPLLVRVPPKEPSELTFNSHQGQEFIYMLEGRLEITLGEKAILLEPGDSIILDSRIPHALRGLDNKDAEFLDVII